MGFLSRLFGRRSAEQPAAPPDVVETPEKPEEKRVRRVEAPVDEIEPDSGLGFDPDATIFLPPRISMHAQQSLRKLRDLRKRNVTRYNWVCTPACSEACKLAAAEGPYSVEDGLSGIAPVPGVGRYKSCACDIQPVQG